MKYHRKTSFLNYYLVISEARITEEFCKEIFLDNQPAKVHLDNSTELMFKL